MLNRFREFWTRLISPIARLLLRLGVSPDAVTVVGTLGVSFGALFFFPRGQLLTGVLVITAFVFSDLFIVKEFAVAISLAVILDATLMRGLIAPSALKLIGPRVWAQGAEARGRMFAGQAMRVGEGQ